MQYLTPLAVLAALLAALLTGNISGPEFLGALVAAGVLTASPSPFKKV